MKRGLYLTIGIVGGLVAAGTLAFLNLQALEPQFRTSAESNEIFSWLADKRNRPLLLYTAVAALLAIFGAYVNFRQIRPPHVPTAEDIAQATLRLIESHRPQAAQHVDTIVHPDILRKAGGNVGVPHLGPAARPGSGPGSRLVVGASAIRQFEELTRREGGTGPGAKAEPFQVRLLRKKLQSDFEDSWLGDVVRSAQATRKANDDLLRSGIVGMNDIRRGKRNLDEVPIQASTSEDASRLLGELKELDSISVNCGALFPAAASVFLALKETFRAHGIELRVDYSDYNSRNQMLRIERKRDEVDFLFAAEAAFFMAQDVMFRRILVCHGENQWVLVRAARKASTGTNLYVFQESTAEMQFRLGTGVPEHASLRPIGHGEEIPSYLDNLEPGETIVVWEPLAYLFLKDPRFVRLANQSFRAWISLFCRKDWMHYRRAKQRQALVSLFVQQWMLSKADMTKAFEDLLRAEGYLERFAVSAGLQFAPGFGGWQN